MGERVTLSIAVARLTCGQQRERLMQVSNAQGHAGFSPRPVHFHNALTALQWKRMNSVSYLECTSFSDKWRERIEDEVTSRLKKNGKLQYCRQAYRKILHILALAYLPLKLLFLCESSCLWVTWEQNRKLERAPSSPGNSCFVYSSERKIVWTAPYRPQRFVASWFALPAHCLNLKVMCTRRQCFCSRLMPVLTCLL